MFGLLSKISFCWKGLFILWLMNDNKLMKLEIDVDIFFYFAV